MTPPLPPPGTRPARRSRSRPWGTAALLLTCAVALTACSSDEETLADASPTPAATVATPTSTPTAPAPSPTATPVASPTPVPTPSGPVEVAAEEVVTGLTRPWDIAFADGRTFITEQDSGRVLELADDGDLREVGRFDVDPTGEGGLLGVAASPDFASDGLLYVYVSTAGDNRVLRFSPGGEAETVIDGIPHASIHNGGRIAFGPDGLLYIGTGDASEAPLAQDRTSLAGKILRIRPDGSVPDDNPFGSPVWSLGHRNVQGLAWDAGGQLYASEFGPDRDDEINRIEPGNNYGWPRVTGRADSDEFTDPVFVRQPPDASWSGAALRTDSAVRQWGGDLLVASLRGERLWRVDLADDGTVADAEELFVGEFGRLRTAVYAPDGSLWLMTSNTDRYGAASGAADRIIRLAPAS